jgi:cytochrome c oxidase subunit 2
LHGSTVILEDGSQVVADDEYLIRSIKDPQADVAEGYPTRMPENTLDDDEIGSILAYIKELG